MASIKLNTAPKGAKPATVPKEPNVREYIYMTPTWRGVLPLLVAGIEAGNAQARKISLEELYRMADCADRWNAHCKVAATNHREPGEFGEGATVTGGQS